MLCRIPVNAQPYASIDDRVKKIQADAADSLAKKLTSVYKNDKEKTRAIFRWITENIAYDVEGYHKTETLYEGLWNPNLSTNREEIERDYNNKIVQKVLRERRAICDGYSRLFKTLCDYSGVRCTIVSGYIRWSSDTIGVMTVRRHAWNAVFIENSWRLVDATWASGYCNNEVSVFTKAFDDFFFLTDPVQLFNDHYPDDKSWSLLPVTPSLQQFYNFPFYYPSFYRAKINSVFPITGIIDVKNPKRMIAFDLGVTQPVKSLEIVEYPLADSLNTIFTEPREPAYKVENGKVSYSYHVQSDQTKRIDVYLNYKLILTYGLRIF